MPVVRINRKAASRLDSGHPWIFASDILDRGESRPGDAVRVVDWRGQALGTAHYSSASQITLRFLSRRIETVDRAFLRARIDAARELRKGLVRDSDAYRLVYAEGDLLPGLIVDRYGPYFVVQLLNQGMDRLHAEICSTLTDLFAPAGIVARNDSPVRVKEELPLETTILAGSAPERVLIRMNGLCWQTDLIRGQKTGIFLDQRENYPAVAAYARGHMLDCFTGTGGFALHAASRCDHVEAIDSSASALALARANAEANSLTNVSFEKVDVLEYLPHLVAAHKRYDMVVVDPPAFTKSRSAADGAVRGYKEINLRALHLLGPGGVLVSCSCSHHMSEAHLLEVIAAAALDAGKQLRILERRTQSRDHPILLTVPETHYLKCLVFQVI